MILQKQRDWRHLIYVHNLETTVMCCVPSHKTDIGQLQTLDT